MLIILPQVGALKKYDKHQLQYKKVFLVYDWMVQVMNSAAHSPSPHLQRTQSPGAAVNLNSKLVPDDLSTLHLHLLVKPLPVTAALHSTFAWAALRAGVEAAHAIHVQTVAHVLAVEEQSAFAVVHSALCCEGLSEQEKSSITEEFFLLGSISHFLWISLITVSVKFH